MNSLYKFDFQAIIGTLLSYLEYTRLMIAVVCLGMLSGVIYFTFCTPIYSTQSSFSFRVYNPTIQDNSVAETRTSYGTIRALPYNIASPANILATAKAEGIISPNSSIEDVKRKNLKVTAHLGAHPTINIQVDSPDPAVAQDFAKKLVDHFLKNQTATWESYRESALERYSEEVRALEEKAEEDLKKLSQFERDGNFRSASVEQSRVNALPTQLLRAKNQLASMDLLRKQLEDPQNQEPPQNEIDRALLELSLYEKFSVVVPSPQLDIVIQTALASDATSNGGNMSANALTTPTPSSTHWQSFESERQKILASLNKALEIYLPQHASVRSLQKDLTIVEENIKSALNIARSSFKNTYAQVEQEILVLESRFSEYYSVNEEATLVGQEHSRIATRQKIWEQARMTIAQRLATISFTEKVDWIELQFKEYLTRRDSDPVSPSKMKLAMLSLWIGLGGAIGAATLLKLSNTSISTIPQLEGVTDLAAIGLIPVMPQEKLESAYAMHHTEDVEIQSIHETYRTVRSHILLNPNEHGKNQVILITSARPNEGKTSQALNIAWSFASSGKRTLLLDADLRKGRLHRVFADSNESGLSTVLKHSTDWRSAVKASRQDHLDYIPRGPIFHGISDEFSKSNFESLIAEMREEYDYIVLDSPPIIGLNESISMQRVVDGVVLVVRAEVTTRRDLTEMMRLVEISKAHIYGSILNGLNTKKLSNYYYYNYTAYKTYYAEA